MGRATVQCHPLLQSKLEVSLGYVGLCLKKKNNKKKKTQKPKQKLECKKEIVKGFKFGHGPIASRVLCQGVLKEEVITTFALWRIIRRDVQELWC